jgi:cysteinyl-tRNA synthetase
MSAKYLGQPFDIHCGGIDHIPVHHTNEMAQSEAAEGKPLANYWMHGEFLITGEAKMAKSGNNFITLSTIKDNGLSPIAYRYLLLQTHYRKPLAFSIDSLKAAQNGLNHLYAEIKKLPDDLPGQDLENKFLERINDDLDTPAAIALVWEGIKNNSICKKSIFKFDNIFGLNIKDEIDKVKEKVEEPIPEHVNNILLERNNARANRDWVKSDELREQLESIGYIVKDTPAGTEITKA